MSSFFRSLLNEVKAEIKETKETKETNEQTGQQQTTSESYKMPSLPPRRKTNAPEPDIAKLHEEKMSSLREMYQGALKKVMDQKAQIEGRLLTSQENERSMKEMLDQAQRRLSKLEERELSYKETQQTKKSSRTSKRMTRRSLLRSRTGVGSPTPNKDFFKHLFSVVDNASIIEKHMLHLERDGLILTEKNNRIRECLKDILQILENILDAIQKGEENTIKLLPQFLEIREILKEALFKHAVNKEANQVGTQFTEHTKEQQSISDLLQSVGIVNTTISSQTETAQFSQPQIQKNENTPTEQQPQRSNDNSPKTTTPITTPNIDNTTQNVPPQEEQSKKGSQIWKPVNTKLISTSPSRNREMSARYRLPIKEETSAQPINSPKYIVRDKMYAESPGKARSQVNFTVNPKTNSSSIRHSSDELLQQIRGGHQLKRFDDERKKQWEKEKASKAVNWRRSVNVLRNLQDSLSQNLQDRITTWRKGPEINNNDEEDEWGDEWEDDDESDYDSDNESENNDDNGDRNENENEKNNDVSENAPSEDKPVEETHDPQEQIQSVSEETVIDTTTAEANVEQA